MSDPVPIGLTRPDAASGAEVPDVPASGAAPTAGGLLRQARQARGLHIAALATAIKVAPQKLELLETDRFEQLPGAAFTRALAQTVCRFLKIDPAPVLALLPMPPGPGLDHLGGGLNQPFRDRPGRRPPADLKPTKNPILLVTIAILIAAAGVYFMPKGWLSTMHWPATEGSSPSAANDAAGVVTQNVPTQIDGIDPVVVPASGAMPPAQQASAVTLPAPVALAAPAASAPAGGLVLRAQAASWVEVTDRRGTSLLSRRLQAGETVSLDSASAPLRLKVGNASATEVSFNGRAIDLAPVTRDNVARIELK